MITVLPIRFFNYNPYGYLFKKSLQKKGIRFIDSKRAPLKQALKSNKIDIIHFHWLNYLFNYETLSSAIRSSFRFFCLLIRLKIRGMRCCWTIHNIQPHENRRPIINFIDYFIMAIIADSVVVLSNWQKKQVKKIFRVNNEKIFIAPHANYIGYYKNCCSRDEAREYLGISKTKFVYLFFGRIRKYKGIIDAIEIFRNNRKGNDILLIAGRLNNRDLEGQISALKDDSVILHLKAIENDEVQCYFNAADVCIFPFKKITNSGSVLLAMSFGKPVICPNKGSLIEVVKPTFGICYSEGELAKAMNDIRDKNLERMGKVSYEEAKKYNWDDTADNYLKAYEYALKQ
ncbi:MAG: glycosyltransferase family 4 protein [Deltaproteobacteria bacterium]|nr:glycosyltransferase family 4 protein [Deltaproteobacteria bacterium]